MTPNILEYNQLKDILPQAYPFVLLDRVTDIKAGKSLTAIKNITANEWPFTAYKEGVTHYPETLLIEAAAQAALVLYHVSKVKPGAPHPKYILGKVKTEFFEPAMCGETVALNTFASKMLDENGYMDINVGDGADKRIGDVQIFYNVVK